jgi:hypothetical protein
MSSINSPQTQFINVAPLQIVQTVVKFKIDIPFIVLNEKAVIKVLCYDIDSNLLTTYSFELIQPDYGIWLKDEDLINYVCNKYNFTSV